MGQTNRDVIMQYTAYNSLTYAKVTKEFKRFHMLDAGAYKHLKDIPRPDDVWSDIHIKQALELVNQWNKNVGNNIYIYGVIMHNTLLKKSNYTKAGIKNG